MITTFFTQVKIRCLEVKRFKYDKLKYKTRAETKSEGHVYGSLISLLLIVVTYQTSHSYFKYFHPPSRPIKELDFIPLKARLFGYPYHE